MLDEVERVNRMEILTISSTAQFSSSNYVKVPLPNTHGLVRLLCLEPGQGVALHKHPDGDEIFYVLNGIGEFTLGKETTRIEAGSFVKAAAGASHCWRNGASRLIPISILMPPSTYELAERTTRMEFVQAKSKRHKNCLLESMREASTHE